MKKGYGALYEKIGYVFRDESLLKEALTHSSVGRSKTNYERLEFLGDRVLGLVVAHLLFDAYPAFTEGDLAPRHAYLVSKPTLASVALLLELHQYIEMASSERRSGGRTKASLLGDVIEALIAALYLDGGFEAARTFITRFWIRAVEEVQELAKDPKSELQEHIQALGKLAPRYEILTRTGPDHAPLFTVEVLVEEFPKVQGTGSSRRLAEQNAAENLLKMIRDRK